MGTQVLLRSHKISGNQICKTNTSITKSILSSFMKPNSLKLNIVQQNDRLTIHLMYIIFQR